jgi:hypothetical protein
MPSKKQRRRRQKERRHEYEYVYVDDEGQELDPSEVPEEEERPSTARPKAAAEKPSVRREGRKPARGAVRPVPPPSWKRVAKRGAIFAPFMLLAISLLGKGLSWPARIAETLWLLLLFVPFSYFVDRMMYRRYLKQTGQPLPPPRQRRA